MKITSEAYDMLILEEVYIPITLLTNDNEKITICMIDSGFELTYQQKEGAEYHSYEFKNGKVFKNRILNKKQDI